MNYPKHSVAVVKGSAVLGCLCLFLLFARGEALQSVRHLFTRSAPSVTPMTQSHAASPIPVRLSAKATLETAGTLAVPQTVMAGGGGLSSSGALTAQGTLGQTLSNASSGGQFTVNSGFWGADATPLPCPTITLTPGALAAGFPGVPYSQTFQASGGSGPYSFSISGTLPPGLTFTNDTLQGTPNTSGTFTFTLTATDANQCTGTQSYALRINCLDVILSPSSLPGGAFGAPYSQQLTAAYGEFPSRPLRAATNASFTLSLQGGALPAGLTLMPNGLLAGTLTPPGTYNFVVKATDGSNDCAGTQAYALTITCPVLTLASLPAAVAGAAYTASLTASPVGGAYTFALAPGASLPSGLMLLNGSIAGTPTTAGTFNFSVVVLGWGGCRQTLPVSLTVNCPTLTVTPASLPNGKVGTAYQTTLTTSPTGGNYSYAVTSGTLPSGLTLASNGVLSGTPAANGSFTFSVTVTGWGGCRKEQSYTLEILCGGLTFSPASLPNGVVGTLYQQTFTVTGGTGPVTFSTSVAILPPGLLLNPNTGLLSGKPTAPGSFTFTILATSAQGCVGQQEYRLTVVSNCPAITFTPATLPDVQTGVAYNQTIKANPDGAYTYSVWSGNLPPGLTLNPATGGLTGTVTALGSYHFTVQALGANGCQGQQSFTLAVTCPTITVLPTNNILPGGNVGAAYTQTLSASPAANYTFTVVSNVLPSGLTLTPNGLLSGTPLVSGAYTFSVRVMGFGSCVGLREYSLTITTSCAAITLPVLPTVSKVGVTYLGNLAGTTPSGSYTFNVENGALPPGLTIDNLFAQLRGKPTQIGTYNFSLKATRNNGCTGTRNYTVTISNGAALALAADYDGNGKADPVLWQPSSGTWSLLQDRASVPQTLAWGSAGDSTLMGDYDGDGKTDVTVYRPSQGTWYVQRSSDGSAWVQTWGEAADLPVPGDYDGDGRTDCAVWRPTEGKWYVLRSSDGGTDVIAWGAGHAPYLDVPVSGDYDGDGRTDLAVFRRGTGYWFIRLSADGSTLTKAWGLGTDVPVVGDYDGDGKADVAVWRGATGQWFIAQSSNDQPRVETWGSGQSPYFDQAAPGDYDGDGKTDLAVWRASTGMWFQSLSSQSGSAAMRQLPQGQSGFRVIYVR